jgi:hypothetical protein
MANHTQLNIEDQVIPDWLTLEQVNAAIQELTLRKETYQG